MSRGSPHNRPANFTATFLRLIDLDEVRVWRMSRRVRMLCAAMVMVMLILTGYVAFWAVRNGGPVSFNLVAVFVVIDIVVLRMARYSYGSVTTAAPDGLHVGRGRRRVTVPWQLIASCQASDRGIVIGRFDGRQVLAAAPQHANVHRGQHTKTKADYAALYITERARMFRLADPARSPDAVGSDDAERVDQPAEDAA